MVPMSVEEIAKAVDGRLVAGDGSAIEATETVTDSRQAGSGAVFVAIKGERVDGHDFVDKVADQGAAAAIVDHEVACTTMPQIVVEDTVAALGLLAKHNIDRRRQLPGAFDLIGLTGSVGKTTTKDLLRVGVAHLGEFGSRERIAQAKSEIVQGLLPGGTAVLNADDDYVVPMAQLASGDVLWFGQGHTRDSEVHADHIAADAADHAEFTMTDAHGEQVAVHLGIPGRHNVMNALAAATVALRYGMPLTAIAQTLAAQHTISPHRMALSTVSRQGASFELIDDSFNANPDSMKAGLDGLRAWNANDGRQPFRVALLGAMLELGADERELHASVGQYAAGLGLDAIITVGSPSDAHLNVLAESLAEGATRGRAASVDCVQTIDEAERIVLDLAKNHTDTVVLLKGSHASGLSALAERWA